MKKSVLFALTATLAFGATYMPEPTFAESKVASVISPEVTSSIFRYSELEVGASIEYNDGSHVIYPTDDLNEITIGATQWSDDTTNLDVEYELININDEDDTYSDSITGTHTSKQGTVKFYNVPLGAYTVKVTNNSPGVISGNFYVYY